MAAEGDLLYGYFVREPSGPVYRCLISTLAKNANRALLVERHGNRSEEGRLLLERIEPWCRVAAKRGSWPGTALMSTEAMVYEYDLSDEVIAALQTAVPGLYAWQGGLPEDLALLREDGDDILYSIAHENEGGIVVQPEEHDRLLQACPEIAECIDWRP